MHDLKKTVYIATYPLSLIHWYRYEVDGDEMVAPPELLTFWYEKGKREGKEQLLSMNQ